MAKSSKVAWIAGSLAIAAGLLWLGWFMFIHPKDQDRLKAQAEILRWEKRFEAARTCFFGPTPYSADGAEALAVYELLPRKELAPSEEEALHKDCIKIVGKISRGPAEDTGNLKIEQAWMTLDRAATDVAKAFAVHQDPFGKTDSDVRMGVQELPAALVALDQARADLRTAAGMSAADLGTAKVQSLPKAQLVPLGQGAEHVTELLGWKTSSLSTVDSLAFHGQDKHPWRIMLTAGGTPTVTTPEVDGTLALPGNDWVATSADGISVTIGPNKAPYALTSIVATGEEGASVRAAGGTLKQAYVIYVANRKLTKEEEAAYKKAVASAQKDEYGYEPKDPSEDAQKVVIATLKEDGWAKQEFPEADVAVTTDVTGATIVTWSDPSIADDPYAAPGTGHAAWVRPGVEPKVITLPAGVPTLSCTTKGAAWVALSGSEAVRIDETGAFKVLEVSGNLVGCGERAALFTTGGLDYTVCSNDCHPVHLNNARATQVAAVSDEKVIAVRAQGSVIGVWTETQDPAFFAMPDTYEPHGAIANGKYLDVIAMPATDPGRGLGAIVLRVPLK
ncbi:MAG TPA: hypothetical protein VGM90_02785 [Kofleriaceae bacterium]|jgi:hypothetical protein